MAFQSYIVEKMKTLEKKSTVMTAVFKTLDALRKMESFDTSFYPIIDDLVANLAKHIKAGIVDEEELKKIRYYYGQEFLENTLQGSALLKKFGYAGDFLMIDAIYSHLSPENPFFKSWDDYFHHQAAPQAVRNRKEYFKNWILKKFETKDEIRLLNIASGPARDLLELFQKKGQNKKLIVTCIDADEHAIRYAKTITEPFQEHVEYLNVNIFKYKPDKKYDLIWSAGAFDYFNDKSFVHLLRKFKNWVCENGEVVVGNFNADHNPTRPYMEIFGEWFLQHRTYQELLDLGVQAGFQREHINVGREKENVNLFLHLPAN